MSQARSTIILSPGSFPWSVSGESTFLGPELAGAREVFDEVILAPQSVGGEREPVSAGVEVVTELAERLEQRVLARPAVAEIVLEDTLRRPDALLHRRASVELLSHAWRAAAAEAWLEAFMRQRGLDPARVTVSTFWWTPATTGFALLRRRLPGLKVFTRAHGFDLYEDRHQPSYIPARTLGLRWLCRVFPDSAAGTEYLKRTSPWASAIVETSRLGVDDPGVRSVGSTDGVLRVVSCAMLRPVKRIGLLIDGLAAAARLAPGLRIEWTHFGTGPLLPELEEAARHLPATVGANFAGYSTQAALYEAYARTPVDVAVNVSESEGTPVSLMEAIACGIPLLVTAVGGNVEVGRPENAVHLPQTPTDVEVGEALLRFRAEVPGAAARRLASRTLWERDYDARTNAFAHFRGLHDWPAVSAAPPAPRPTGS